MKSKDIFYELETHIGIISYKTPLSEDAWKVIDSIKEKIEELKKGMTSFNGGTKE